MNNKRFFILCLFFSSLVLQAQNKDLIIELVSKEPLKKSAIDVPQGYTEIRDYNDSTVAYESPFLVGRDKIAEKMTFIHNDKKFDVETLPGTAIAPEAGILLKFGSRNYFSHKDAEFVVIYYDLNGNKIKELQKKYEGAECFLSKNGYLVMDGKLIGKDYSEGGSVTLYNEKGEEVFTKDLGPDNWVRDIKISPNGNYIALVYTTLMAQPPNDRFNLLILNTEGKLLIDKRYSISFDDLVFSTNENYLLGITYNYIFMVNIKNPSIAWEKNKDYNTERSPILFFERYNSILIQTRFSEGWKLFLLDIETGNEIYNTSILDKQRPLYKKSLHQKSEDGFIIKSLSNSYNYIIKPKN